MKLIKTLFACFALGATALTAFSQASVGTAGPGSTYTVNFLPFHGNGYNPTNAVLQVITTVTAGAGMPGGGTNFNDYGGWTNTTYFTNNYILYTNNLSGSGTAGFYTNTVIITNNQVVYPSIFIPKQTRLALEYVGTVNNGGSPTNVVFTFARSVSGRNGLAATYGNFTWTIPVTNNAAGQWTSAVTNLPADTIGGEGYLYLVNELYQSTNGTIWTNYDGGLLYGLKPSAGN